jgi:tetratricopeptide (TPR) repeat protein
MSLAELGRYPDADVHGEDLEQIADALEQPFSVVAVSWCAGLLHVRKGAYHKAVPMLERGFAICRELTLPLVFPRTASLLALAYALSGRHHDALFLLEQFGRDIPSTHYPYPALVMAEFGEVALRTGRLAEARELASGALVLARERQERGHQAWSLWLHGEIAMHCEPMDVKPAEVYYQQALAIANELEMRPLQAHCHRGLGDVHRHTQESEPAMAELTEALEQFREMDMAFWIPQVETALSQLKRP